jgi:hypothetical protein
MPPAKKLQVFVSSTYTDLREERQAAVEAILTAGHIPAGMELFTAGDESQMDVIRRWIDESDVFLLILGGRYGSLETQSGKSYVHLEYEYAIERGKPLFAVVINEAALEERVKRAGTGVIEIENSGQLREFRKVVLSRLVRFWSDLRDIKLAIHETMREFSRRSDLRGWVPGDQAVSGGFLAEETARLSKENTDLRKRIAASSPEQITIDGITFEDWRNLLRSEVVDPMSFRLKEAEQLTSIAGSFDDSELNLLHVLWSVQEQTVRDPFQIGPYHPREYYRRLEVLGLVHLSRISRDEFVVHITNHGRSLLLRMMTQFQ